MIGYHIDTHKIVSSEGDVCQGDYLAWLLSDHTRENGAFPNLDHAVAALLKLIGVTKEEGRGLLASHKLFTIDARRRAFRLTYYPGKFFNIDFGWGRNHAWRTFYHMGQYGDFQHSKDSSIDHAIAQAKEAKQLGGRVLSAFQEMGITSENLTSPINAFIRSNLFPPIPTVDSIPEEAGLLAYQCLRGNWVESYKLGSFDAYDLDISSAFGYELSKLYDTRRGVWLQSKSEPPDAVYGFCKGLLTITVPFHPFLVGNGDMQYTSTGSWGTYITKQEWDFIREYRLGYFEPEDGFYWIPNNGTQYQPFKGVVNHLWQLRQSANPLTDKILKRILAGIWGTLLQTMGGDGNLAFGKFFNPVYGALVESNCRLAVARTVLDNNLYPDYLLNISVDGITTTRPVPAETSGELGTWRLAHQGKAIIVSSGVVGMEGKGGDEDFSVTYDKLLSLIEAHPRAQSYKMKKLSPVTLAKALNEDRWQDLGKLETIARTIHVRDERKRFYPKMPKCGRDLLDHVYSSSPWDISVIQKPNIELAERTL